MFATLSLNPDETNFRLDLAEGRIRGHEEVLKFGLNPDLDSGVIEDIWDAGGDFVYQTSAQSLEVLSSDVNDTSAGTGMRVIRVFGLDANWNRVQEDVIMNGTSIVALTENTYLRVYRLKGLTAGSGFVNAGNITLRLASAGVTQGMILAGFGQSQMAIYSIPAGFTGYLTDIDASLATKNTAVVITDLMVRTDPDNDGCWLLKHRIAVSKNSPIPKALEGYIPLSEKTDIRIRGDSDSVNIEFTAGFEIILVSNAQPTKKTQLVSLKDDALPASEVILVSAQANKRPFVQSLVLDKDGLATSIEVSVGDTVILQSVSAAGVLVTLNGMHIGNTGEDIRVKAEGIGTGKYHITCGFVDEELKGGELE